MVILNIEPCLIRPEVMRFGSNSDFLTSLYSLPLVISRATLSPPLIRCLCAAYYIEDTLFLIKRKQAHIRAVLLSESIVELVAFKLYYKEKKNVDKLHVSAAEKEAAEFYFRGEIEFFKNTPKSSVVYTSS